ncbi:MAG: hypothetical protein GVY24_06045 [Planctomycetes bacterium]|jgi:hypothetical protein|nr:hypothetical protein [Planctomycetota bacterium]
MNNVIMRSVALTTEYQPLSAVKLIGSVTISAPPTNSANVLFENDHSQLPPVPWVPGEWHEFRSVNLAEIVVKGTPGDFITVVGGTW